jgi:hypothetical protein
MSTPPKYLKIFTSRKAGLHSLKCVKTVGGWGFAPDPTGELTALPQTPSWIKGAASRQRHRRKLVLTQGTRPQILWFGRAPPFIGMKNQKFYGYFPFVSTL